LTKWHFGSILLTIPLNDIVIRKGKEALMDEKEIIIMAAIQEFEEKGRYSARMEDIARRAGISKMRLHQQFATLDELFKEVIKAFSRRIFREEE